jgi:TonB family protein
MATSESFRLELLPERKIDGRALAVGYGLIVFLILTMINIGWIWPDRLQIAQKYRVTEIIPLPSLQPKPLQVKAPKPVIKAKLLPPAPVFQTPRLVVPREVHTPQRQQPIEAPKLAMNDFAPAQVKVSGARPALIVHTGEFGSSTKPTINAPIQKVQAGGFGDPNGLRGEGKPGAHLVAASTGSFDLPQGPGQGNGTGGANGLKGTIASAGFGNGIAQPGQGDGRANGRGAIQTSGFSTQTVAQGGTKPMAADNGPATTLVQILSKPNPVYTEEARQLKLEGEVLLEIMFGANGQLHVNRVVRGMGHGLDESAINAANKMRFRPAMRNGQPVDSMAIVHVIFQLAY